jgi:hypothetical protein
VVLLLVALAVSSILYVPKLALTVQRDTYKRYARSVGGVLGLLDKSKGLAGAARATVDPQNPASRVGRSQLTEARQTSAAALHDLRNLRPPIGAEEGQARLDFALVSWGKSLDAIEVGYAAHSMEGWIQAINDSYGLATVSTVELDRAKVTLVRGAKAAGFTYKESSDAFGSAAALLVYEPDSAPAVPAAAPPEVGYQSGLKTAVAAYVKAQTDFRGAETEFDRAEVDATLPGDVAAARKNVEERATAALARMRKATQKAQAAASAIAATNDPAKTKAFAAGQRDLAKVAGTIAFVVMPGRVRADDELLAASLSGDYSVAAERRFARLISEGDRLTQLERSMAPVLKRVAPLLPFLDLKDVA